jgi:transposase-like protein
LQARRITDMDTRQLGFFEIRNDIELELIRLQLREITQKWRMAPREWSAAKAQFAVVFGDRFEVNR